MNELQKIKSPNKLPKKFIFTENHMALKNLQFPHTKAKINIDTIKNLGLRSDNKYDHYDFHLKKKYEERLLIRGESYIKKCLIKSSELGEFAWSIHFSLLRIDEKKRKYFE